mmetsp:Transcript_44641/g.111886  ORF Transcript_44641/g.111886 Transcript_44641/m.111886 type:complete len:322 (+) Transcript_44641:148-1113(+)
MPHVSLVCLLLCVAWPRSSAFLPPSGGPPPFLPASAASGAGAPGHSLLSVTSEHHWKASTIPALGQSLRRSHRMVDLRMSSTAARFGIQAVTQNPSAMARGIVGMGSVLASLPKLAWVGYNNALGLNPLLVDAITTMFLYVLGQLTLSLLTGKISSKSVMSRWAFFGIIDGVFTHKWYKVSEWLAVAMHPAGGHAAHVGIKIFFTGGFYTPAYCLLFILVGALWDGKRGQQVINTFKEQATPLLKGTVPVWTALNVLLFWYVPMKYRVLVAEIFHYVYLIGLAIWEAGTRAKAAAKQAQIELAELEKAAAEKQAVASAASS